MHTLYDIESRSRDVNSVRRAPGAVVPGWLGRPSVTFPEGGSVSLPRSSSGLELWNQEAPPGALAGLGDADLARSLLACNPSFVMRLPSPTDADLRALGESPEKWRREAATRFISAVAVDLDGKRLYGLARSTVVENKLGFGQSAYLQHEEVWYSSLEELAERLAEYVGDSVNVQLSAEPGSAPWIHVVFLLTNQDDEIELPGNWSYHMKAVAGLFAVDLDVYRSAGAATRSIIKDLQSRAPAGLLVSARSVPSADVFLEVYSRAREGGYGAMFGSADAESFSDYLLELTWLLRDMRKGTSKPEDLDESATWKQVKPAVQDLEGEHFILTKRAKDSLANNAYPKPKRMLDHLAALEKLAKQHFEGKGQLAQRLTDAALAYGIEVSLFDDSMPATTVDHCGKSHSTKPHVKVDDVKSPADCGRIYFAVDRTCYAFIVDHIGLHNYY